MGWAQPLFQFTSSEDDVVEEMVYGQNTDLYQHDDQSSSSQNPQKKKTQQYTTQRCTATTLIVRQKAETGEPPEA